MNLRELVEQLGRSKKIIHLPQLPAELKTKRSYERVSEKYSELNFVDVIDYDAMLEKLRHAAESRTLADFTYREMRLAAGCLFDGKSRLADNTSFLNLYLEALRALRSRLAVKRLIYIYCLHFDPADPAIRRLAEFLREAIREIGGRWDWPERQKKYRIFEPTEAPQQIANLTKDSTDPHKELQAVGLRGPLLAGGLAVYAYLDTLRATRKALENNPTTGEVDRAIAWTRTEDGKTLFSAQRGKLANALLLPFVQNDPSEIIQRKVQNHLLEILSDPRIDKVQWIGAEEEATDVMVRWLAEATLEQFLKVVDRVAAKQQQWHYRRSFWGAYIKKRVVTNSWVAFGSAGVRYAKQLSKDSSGKILLRFATLNGAGADQAVLLLRIGDLVIADWSHNGRLRIWRKGNDSSPEFNSPDYLASALRTDSDFDAVHNPPDGWQAKVEAYIRRHTNIRLSEHEYMPAKRS